MIDCFHSNLLFLYPLCLEVFIYRIYSEFHIIKNKHFIFFFTHYIYIRPKLQVLFFIFSFLSYFISPYLATTRCSCSIPEINMYDKTQRQRQATWISQRTGPYTCRFDLTLHTVRCNLLVAVLSHTALLKYGQYASHVGFIVQSDISSSPLDLTKSL